MIGLVESIWALGIPCVFRIVTGAYCPGCGGTRSILYLLHGQLLKSLQYHPLVVYSVVTVLIWMICWLFSKRWQRLQWLVRKYPLFIYIGIGIIVINWGFKNYMLLINGIDLLP